MQTPANDTQGKSEVNKKTTLDWSEYSAMVSETTACTNPKSLEPSQTVLSTSVGQRPLVPIACEIGDRKKMHSLKPSSSQIMRVKITPESPNTSSDVTTRSSSELERGNSTPAASNSAASTMQPTAVSEINAPHHVVMTKENLS